MRNHGLFSDCAICRATALLKEVAYQLSVCNPFDAANLAHEIEQFLEEIDAHEEPR